MRVAIVSDIHGNLIAFEAVLADLKETAPDLVLHGGDLSDAGSSPVEVVDRIRALGWQGVLGNTDEMLAAPDVFEEFAAHTPQLDSLWAVVREMAAWTREKLGSERVAWLGAQPRLQIHDGFALVHASPDTTWRAPNPDAVDAALLETYTPLNRPLVVYGHVHQPYIRIFDGLTVANSGSVSLSYDGDPRASYLLIEDSAPDIRRVEYDVDAECKRLAQSGLPHADFIARAVRAARPSMP